MTKLLNYIGQPLTCLNNVLLGGYLITLDGMLIIVSLTADIVTDIPDILLKDDERTCIIAHVAYWVQYLSQKWSMVR